MMNYQEKSKEDLIKYIEKLQQEITSLKSSNDKILFESKQTENTLRASEENLYITLLSIGDGVIATDNEGFVVNINPVAEVLCGWKKADALGKPLTEIFKIINSETKEIVPDPVKKVLESGKIVGLANHTVLISKDRSEYQIADSAAPIKNKEGEIIGVVLVFSDVTENYNSQKQIVENEERYRNLLLNLEAGIVVHAPDTSIVMNNHRASELLGLTDDQMRGKVAIDAAWDFIDEDNHSLSFENYPVNRILITKKPIKNQILGICHSGKKDIVWVTVNGFPMLTTNGEISEIVISFIDITEQKRTEKELVKSERELKRAQQITHIGSWYLDLATNKVVWTEELYKMYGFNPALPPPDYTEHKKLFTPESWEVLATSIANTAKTGIPYELELKTVKADGRNGWMWVRGETVQDAEGKTIGLWGAAQDITERKKAEEVLMQTEQELRRQNELFNSLIENLPMGVFMAEAPSGKPLIANEVALNLLGRGILPEVSKNNLAEVYQAYRNDTDHPYPVDEMPVVKGLNGEFSHVEDMLVLKPDGSKTYLEIYGSPVKDDKGAIWASLVSFSDISERKLSESIFKDIIEKNPMSIQILDMEGYVIQTNPAHTKLFGVSPPSTYSVFKDEQLLKQGFEDFFNRIKKGEVVYFPDSYFNVRDVDPSYPDFPIWVKAMGFALNDNNGNPERVVLMHENITERKHAEALFNDVIDKNPMSIQIVDKEGYTLHGNPAYIKLFGAIPPPYFSIFDDLKNKSPELANLISQAKNGEVVHLPDVYFNAHDVVFEAPDIPLWIKALIFPLKDSKGKPERFVFMHENITERKQAETILAESEQLLRESQMVAHLGSFTWDLSTGLWKSSAILDEIFGIDTDFNRTLEGWASIVHPHWQTIMKDYVTTEVLGKHKDFDKEYKIIRINDGKECWLHGKAKLIIDSNNQPIKLIGTISDISERKQSEKQLNLLKRALDQSPVTVVITNKEGNVEYANPRFIETTGYSITEIMGRNPNVLKSGEQSKEFYENLWNTILSGSNWYGDFHNKKKNGELYWESAVISPIANSNGEIAYFIAIKEDITEKKKMLEDLINAKDRAEESDRLKSAFLANMSHEIRTPMNGILGFAELLKEPELTGEQQKNYIGIIEKSGARMLNIINDIIDISKIEAGLMKVEMQESNVIEQIEYIYTFFKPEVENKGMQLIINNKLSAKEAIVYTDREKLYAILTNLVKNAIKYSNTGYIEIGCEKIKASQNQENKQEHTLLRFFVKDTGIGIPNDRQQAIFERFIQADIEDEMARQGAGLGLAITKSYLAMMGGEIWVESEVGIGSCFYFTLPCIAKMEEKIHNNNARTDIQNYACNLKILIAEDDETSEMLLSIIAGSYGREIIKVKNGNEAIEACHSNPDIDLILMDIQMPKMGGYEAARQIRKFNKQVVIIAQTAFGLFGDKEKAIQAGCNDYLAKPINKADFIKLIYKYFDNTCSLNQ